MHKNSKNQQQNLSTAKHLLLQKLKQGQLTIASRNSQAIPRRQDYSPVPLSFMQQRLWFIDQLVAGTRAYNLSFTIRIGGYLNINILQDSLNEVIRRHEALRTTFSVIDDQPMQVIAPSFALQLSPIDLQSLRSEEKEATAQSIIKEEAKHIFDLAKGPLIRPKLLRLTHNDHILFLLLHHTICDGWSLGILDQELWTLYNAFLQGRHSPLPELPIQYADFTVWQRQRLQEEQIKDELNYWIQNLTGSPSLLRLPTDRPRPSVQTFHGRHHPFDLPESLTREIKVLSQQEGTTVFMTLLAAFQLLLSFYSQQGDIVIGSPVANRQRVEVERLIGFFANTLVFRTKLAGCSCFRDLLSRVREVTLGALAHQNIPFEQLVAALQIERDMSKNPLFQVMFNFGNDVPLQPVAPADLRLEILNMDVETAMFDLWLSMWEDGNKLKGIMEFNTDLFDLSTIQRMQNHFQHLLEIVTANPSRALNFSLLTLSEQQQILVEWNATEKEYAQSTHLHHFFEVQAEQNSEAVAVVFGDHYLTYGELNKRANQLAHYLRALGVRPESLVGLYMERSLEMVVGIFGTLKAGGAYLPLDPLYPQERLAFMLSDTQVPLVLTQDHLRQRIATESVRMISLDREWPIIACESSSSLVNIVRPENIAYVIYTSGSTGKPKGVMNSHEGICNRILWMQEAYQLTKTDRILQKTPFSFDVSVWEFFWPLSTGATLVVAMPEGHRDSAYLVNLIVEQQITTLHFVPSMLDIFLNEYGSEQCLCLKRVISSGEALLSDTLERLHARLGEVALHNLYGPTEAAVDVTHWSFLQKGLSNQSHIVPIGRPIANMQIYLLDEHLNSIPVGVPGELYIGGIGVARGYFNRPDMTAERFLPHPFSSKPGARLYKTGDIARYLPDGCIEFLGRLDHQIKLHGLRIELGEIEAALMRHPFVQDALVTTHTDDNGSKQLVAYVVPRSLSQLEESNFSMYDQLGEQVMQWQQVFDEAYHTTFYQLDHAFNIAGWNSSYTGRPFSEEEMREWVEGTIARILSLHPNHVLEIGCGTGLLLFRIAPFCAEYIGTDISDTGLNYIDEQIKYNVQKLEQVTLYRKAADDLSWMEPNSFDTIILNSVIQYFPNVDYLLCVLEQAIRLTKSDGHIFLGDVRNLQLIEEFHTSVELYAAPDDMSTTSLLQRVRHRINRENELVVDPAFFVALKQRFPGIRHIDLQLKHGRYHNEMTRFRYDVILHINHERVQGQEEEQAALTQMDWQKHHLTIPRLRHLLREEKPAVMRIINIPNARLRSEVQISSIFTTRSDAFSSVKELRQLLQEPFSGEVVEPEELWELGSNLPYIVNVGWSEIGTDGCLEVTLYRRLSSTTNTEKYKYYLPWDKPTAHRQQSWLHYTNNPLQNQSKSQIESQLRSFLGKHLPEYMVPTFIIALESWPLTPNGKIDRRALPAPDVTNAFLQEHFIAARTATEQTLVSIWSQVLGLERIGINHNFFSLGGDSIRCIQIVARAGQAGLRMTPRMLFEHQTIASLATVVQSGAPVDGEKKSMADVELSVTSPFALIDQQVQRQLLEVWGDIEDAYPLSPMQQNMLVQRRYTGNNELYWLTTAAISLRGAQLDIPAYQEAWQLLTDQHPTMRTSFVWEGLEEPLQIVHKRAKLSTHYFDWRELSSTVQQAQLDEYIRVKRRTGSDLSAPTHSELSIFRVADHDYYVIRSFNYMLQDGWSSSLVERDFDAFYEALCEGKHALLKPPRHYRDYINWLQKQDLDKAEVFWREKLQGLTSTKYLLGESVLSPPHAAAPFSKEVLTLSITTTTALQALSRQHQVTVATFLYSAWALLLSRYSGKEDIVFGCLCSGRPTDLAGSEYIIGFFNNILPLRIQVMPRTELLPWLMEIQTQMMELREYEYSPMKQIKQRARMPDALPLFESYVVYENFPNYQYKEVGRKSHRDHGIWSGDARKVFVPTEYPFRVEFWPFQPLQMMLSGYQQYGNNTTLAHMLSQMKKIVESIVECPNQCLGDLMRIIDIKW